MCLIRRESTLPSFWKSKFVLNFASSNKIWNHLLLIVQLKNKFQIFIKNRELIATSEEKMQAE